MCNMQEKERYPLPSWMALGVCPSYAPECQDCIQHKRIEIVT